jgi:GNAT superfamily N-acetyltransferase
VSEPVVRPMAEADLPAVERLTAESYHELETRNLRRSDPEPQLRPPHRAAQWVARTGHFLATDPGGCWVAEDDTGLLGAVVSYRRELMWVLASYAVRPGRQGRGLGTALLAAAQHHGRGCLRAMLSASSDPLATRRYWRAGFALHPQLYLSGTVDRAAIPVGTGDKVRDGSPADVELMDSLDRRTRGAAHGPDHDVMSRLWRLRVSDTSTGAGYAYVEDDGRVQLLAASNRRTAERLLWDALAATGGATLVAHVSAANQWAVDVALTARLALHQEGYLGLRGLAPPAPYLHNGVFL